MKFRSALIDRRQPWWVVACGLILTVWIASCSDDATSPPNDPPIRPHTPSPADGAQAQPAYLTLSWDSSDPDGDVIFYDVLLDTIDPPVKHLSQLRDQKSTQVTVSQGRRYFWRVVAFDTTGESVTGPVWSFETGVFPNGWSFRSPMAKSRIGAMGATLAGKIYVFGGFGAEGLEISSEEYDPATDSWRFVSDLPTPRAYGLAVGHGDYIYVIGGSASGQPRDVVERYHPTTDTWSTMAGLPQARSRFAGDIVGDQIYLFGGFENHRGILKYDIAADAWSIVDSLPQPRNGHTATYLGSEFYLVAGSTPANFWLDNVESYDPAAKDFDPLPPLPSVRRDHRASAVNGKLYITGGYNSITLHQFFGSVEEYDPVRAVWRTKSEMQIPRHDHVAVVLDGLIYCIGGYKEATPNEERSVEVYDPTLDP